MSKLEELEIEVKTYVLWEGTSCNTRSWSEIISDLQRLKKESSSKQEKKKISGLITYMTINPYSYENSLLKKPEKNDEDEE